MLRVGFLAPLDNPKLVLTLAERNITSFAIDNIPRVTRAQSMDALTSMATVAGYKAVLVVANHLVSVCCHSLYCWIERPRFT